MSFSNTLLLFALLSSPTVVVLGAKVFFMIILLGFVALALGWVFLKVLPLFQKLPDIQHKHVVVVGLVIAFSLYLFA